MDTKSGHIQKESRHHFPKYHLFFGGKSILVFGECKYCSCFKNLSCKNHSKLAALIKKRFYETTFLGGQKIKTSQVIDFYRFVHQRSSSTQVSLVFLHFPKKNYGYFGGFFPPISKISYSQIGSFPREMG